MRNPELSDREKEVVTLLGQGKADREIQSELDIEYSTLRTHITNIMQKLHLDNRTKIALYAHGIETEKVKT